MYCIRLGVGFDCRLFRPRWEWHRGFCEDLQLGMLPCLVRLVALITSRFLSHALASYFQVREE
jgi:hypothetical protein